MTFTVASNAITPMFGVINNVFINMCLTNSLRYSYDPVITGMNPILWFGFTIRAAMGRYGHSFDL